jgi:hypothetical protein
MASISSERWGCRPLSHPGSSRGYSSSSSSHLRVRGVPESSGYHRHLPADARRMLAVACGRWLASSALFCARPCWRLVVAPLRAADDAWAHRTAGPGRSVRPGIPMASPSSGWYGKTAAAVCSANNPTEASRHVVLVQLAHAVQMRRQRCLYSRWQYRSPILMALAFTDQNLLAGAVNVLHSATLTRQQAPAGPI